MICCLESPFNDAQSSYYSQVVTDEKLLDKDSHKKKTGGSLYPGLRRTPHGPPADHPVPNDKIGNNHTNNNNTNTNSGLISVTVPPGVLPGQEIHVQRPDGGHGLVEVVVPPGMKEGSVFYVKAPPPVEESSSSNQQQQQQPQSQQQYQPPSSSPMVPVDNANAPSSNGDFANCLLDNNDNNAAKPSIVWAKQGKRYRSGFWKYVLEMHAVLLAHYLFIGASSWCNMHDE